MLISFVIILGLTYRRRRRVESFSSIFILLEAGCLRWNASVCICLRMHIDFSFDIIMYRRREALGVTVVTYKRLL